MSDSTEKIVESLQRRVGELEQMVDAAMMERPNIMASLLEADAHTFSNAPCCVTCTKVSALVNRPFGCIRIAEALRKDKRQS